MTCPPAGAVSETGMRFLLLLPVLLFLSACDKAEEKTHPVAPAYDAPSKPKPLPPPVADAPAPVVATPPPAPPPAPPTPEELAALQKEVAEVVALGAPLLTEGGTVADPQALRARVVDLLKRRGKLMAGMSQEQRTEMTQQFLPVMKLRAKLMPAPGADILKRTQEARDRIPSRRAPLTPPAPADPPAPEPVPAPQ